MTLQDLTNLDSDRTYQIFKREADNTTVCIETVKGIQEARRRVEALRVPFANVDRAPATRDFHLHFLPAAPEDQIRA